MISTVPCQWPDILLSFAPLWQVFIRNEKRLSGLPQSLVSLFKNASAKFTDQVRIHAMAVNAEKAMKANDLSFVTSVSLDC